MKFYNEPVAAFIFVTRHNNRFFLNYRKFGAMSYALSIVLLFELPVELTISNVLFVSEIIVNLCVY